MKDGSGIEILFNEGVYKGSFLNGLRHEKGIYADLSQNVYNGNWKLGIMHGKGLLQTETSTYLGQFINWLKHG